MDVLEHANMPQRGANRTYGRRPRRLRTCAPLAELDVNFFTATTTTTTTTTTTIEAKDTDDPIKSLVNSLQAVDINRTRDPKRPTTPQASETPHRSAAKRHVHAPFDQTQQDLRLLTWEDVCPVGDRIDKIAEASYAEVYRITNDRGTSIIKAIRLESPIKPQTKSQQNSGLVDEEPHRKDDLDGELQISELLADIPGFVVYKEKYVVQGRTTPALLATHQTFHRKMKRKDPERLQFYPSPSRYLNDTRFLVVELGDAGTALEDLDLVSTDQLWDIFLHVAVALARAEDLVRFEHRDLHEGNVCVREVGPSVLRTAKSPCRFGYSGLDVTILDYGLSRAENPDDMTATPIAHDLEKDLGLFTSIHAKQCKVYRQMRSYLLRGDRVCLPPKRHNKRYGEGVNGPVSWYQHQPYTNVLWLAYLYEYLLENFHGGQRHLAVFRRETREFWEHLDPEAPPEVLSFPSAAAIVEFALETGWIQECQMTGTAEEGDLSQAGDGSTISAVKHSASDNSSLRRSPRRRAGPLSQK